MPGVIPGGNRATMTTNTINVKDKKKVCGNWGRLKKWMKRFSNKQLRRKLGRDLHKDNTTQGICNETD